MGGGSGGGISHRAIVTSGGFIWKIEKEEAKKKKSTQEGKPAEKVAAEKEAAKAKKPLIAGISMGKR